MKFDASYHPILNSRICAIKLFVEPNNVAPILQGYSQFLSTNGMDHQFDAYYEVFLGSVFLDNHFIFKWLGDVRLKLIPSSIYHAQHQQVAFLSSLFEALLEKDKQLIEQTLISIRTQLFRNSYKDFMLALLRVYTSTPNDSLTDFGYSRFSEWVIGKNRLYLEL
jgi:hypothetical protein